MTLNRDSNDPGRMAYGFDVGLLQSHRRLMHTSPHRILKHSVFDDAGNRRHFFARRPLMKVHMLSETVAFRPYDFLIDVSSGPWDYGLPGSARCIDCLYKYFPSVRWLSPVCRIRPLLSRLFSFMVSAPFLVGKSLDMTCVHHNTYKAHLH